MVHVRFNGRSYDINPGDLRLNQNPARQEILNRVADYLRVNKNHLAGYVVDKTKSGDLIIRPEAVYG